MAMDVLRIAATGLLVSQRQMEVTGNNVANSGNEGYSRQRVEVSAMPAPAGASPGGARALSVTRIRDTFADATFREENSVAQYDSARAGLLGKIEDSMGSLDSGLNSLMDKMFTTFNDLSIQPQDNAARQSVLNAVGQITSEIKRIYSTTLEETQNARTQLSSATDQANGLLKKVAQLNSAISVSNAAGNPPNDLLDERDQVVDKLNSLVGAKASVDSSGRYEVSIGGWPAVLGENAAQLKVAGDGTPTSPLSVVVVSVDGGNGPAITSVGGEAGGLMATVSQDVPQVQAWINNVAKVLADKVNIVQQKGFDLNGVQGTAMLSYTAGQEASSLSLAKGFTVASIAASSTAAGFKGDGNNALAFANVRNDATGPVVTLRTFASNLGSVIDSANRNSAVSQAVASGSQQSRTATSGVNVDEELVDLMRFQRAYQASARVVSVADELLDTVINRMIR